MQVQTPLDRAATKWIVNVVRFLIERGREVDSRDVRGWTHDDGDVWIMELHQ